MQAGGRLVGTAMLTPYGEGAATFSIIIVEATMRGAGIGKRLMNALMEAAGLRECRLVATQDGLKLNQRLGFAATGEIRQYTGIVIALPQPPGCIAHGSVIATATAADLPELAALDREAIGMDRRALLERLMTEGQLLCLRDAQGVCGYVAYRRAGAETRQAPSPPATMLRRKLCCGQPSRFMPDVSCGLI